MSSKPKIVAENSCSKLEAKWNGLEPTYNELESNTVVNPLTDSYVGYTIIIDLPQLKNVNVKKLGKYNKLISRFPLQFDGVFPVKYELIPYGNIDFRLTEDRKPYKNRILNKYMLMDPNFNVTEEDRYILGTEVATSGYINLIGYLVLKTIKS